MNGTIAHDPGFAQACLSGLVWCEVAAILADAGYGPDAEPGEIDTIVVNLMPFMRGRVDDHGYAFAEFETDGPLSPLAVARFVADPTHPAHGMSVRRQRREAEEREEWQPPSLPPAIQRRLRGLLPPEIPPDPDDDDLPPDC